ncbi:hypothetical protein H4217_002143 [Coemansia sp. RSA 1939]|nr:hypothetical protein H4217_002143 [Coemansia sp. RSA 1939]KAJ2614646.1 hypothetical protein EV177_001949 [Coemansia sp. RSA 1804]KAJ2694920.1 hypothetical protein GGH99_000431 [Coemansia sp. RSA 1285]
MSWLQRNLFSRKRTQSQAKDEEKAAVHRASESQPDAESELHETTTTNDSNEKAAIHRATLSYDARETQLELELEPESDPDVGSGNDLLDSEAETVDSLFARLSVAEVRQYEKTLQTQIDGIQKRMRKVATKHYHDLINAADSVVAMDASSANISMKLTSLKTMLDDAHAANARPFTKAAPVVKGADDPQTGVYAAAAQIKVLIDTPEQIWKALEAHHFLQAALLYMIACKIHQRLGAEQHRASTSFSGRRPEFGDSINSASQTRPDPIPAFPVVERQWAAIASFREQIIAKAHHLLEISADDVPIEANASAICAIALLDDVDAEMACTLFLTRRGQSLAPLLERIGAYSGEPGGLPVLLQELLGRLWQILVDYVIIFGVPGDESDPMSWHSSASAGIHQQRQKQKQYASWMLTTLASLSADSDLPVSPSLQPLWQDRTVARNADVADDGRQTIAKTGSSDNVSLDTAASTTPPKRTRPGRSISNNSSSIKSRRRKSSIAGSVLSSTLTVSPLTEGFQFDTLRSPITPTEKNWSASRTQSTVGGVAPSDWIGAHALSDTKKPWQLNARPGSRTSGMFIISKYLPEEIAQYRPPLPRILDSEAVLHHQSDTATLDEAAEEEEDGDEGGLEQVLNNPHRLLQVLATQIQPRLEQTAADVLALWWKSITDNMRAAMSRAIEQRVLSVTETAEIGAAMHKWESTDTRMWTRGFSLVAVGANSVLSGVMADGGGSGGGSLYRLLVEPLLRDHARTLLCSAVDRALAAVDVFLQSATDSDVAAGALPWRPLPLDSRRMLETSASALEADSAASTLPLDELVRDICGAANAEPVAVRMLKQEVSGSLLEAWRDGGRWWMQISGQTAFAEAMECSRYFVQQWHAMAARLAHWTAESTVEARRGILGIETASTVDDSSNSSISAEVPPAKVLLCIKGAWAAVALAQVAQTLFSSDTPALVRECWQQLDATPAALGDSLQESGHMLLEPWLEFLGSGMALAWAAEFDTLYYTVPRRLRADASATRSDVVEAWSAAALSQGAGSTPWSARYAALRRVSATMAAEAVAGTHGRANTPSAAVRRLAIAHRMRVQTVVGGLGVLGRGVDADRQQRSVALAFANTMCAVLEAKQLKAESAGLQTPPGAASGSAAVVEWDDAQLTTDISFALHELLGQQPLLAAHRSASSNGNGDLAGVVPWLQQLAELAR